MKTSFQDPSSRIIEQLIIFHDHTIIIIITIKMIVGYIIVYIIINLITNPFILENQFIELI
ncbi:MAG: cytochrome c oxidase subunit II transmembrane domain-containing protein [Candidatus Tisiphia sp.]